ncbi:MAG: D-alanyl-D-alanine carboxypeptidase [Lachnospiraceae bacterium]|jgi:D-alanyl-D-alanine carboxypeptidase (penicillin-binding protein 5/6)|nr:D-alanyl-D-alanine carboxypeptidase [Lachnospiraceae bacterium]
MKQRIRKNKRESRFAGFFCRRAKTAAADIPRRIPLALMALSLCMRLGLPADIYALDEEHIMPADTLDSAVVPQSTIQDPSISSDTAEEPTPDPFPPSYYLPVESNEIPGWPQGPQVQAESAVLMDMDCGICLYEKNSRQRQYPASITKIMTALLTAENAKLSDVVTFSENAVYGIEPDSSHIGITAGEQLTVEESLYGLLLASANEVAMGLAEHVAGSVEAFVEMMNEKARSLGCQDTHFVNPHGLHDENHYVTAYDMALIARAAYQNPTFRKIAGTAEHEIPPTNLQEEARYLVNNHKLLSNSSMYYDGCQGGKTGFTDQALNTLVTFAQRDNRTFVCVDLKTNGTPIYADTGAILDYGFTNFFWTQTELKTPVDFEIPLISQEYLFYHWKNAKWTETHSPGKVLLPREASTSDLTEKTAMEPNIAGPWRIASMYYYNGQYVGHSYQYENPLLKQLLR